MYVYLCVCVCVLWLVCIKPRMRSLYCGIPLPLQTRARRTHTHTEMLCGHASMRTCGICAPPHLLSQFPGRTPVLLGGGGVGGEAGGGVEEDTEVGAKASVPHLSLCFLASPGSVSPCDITIQATGRSFASGPANKFALLSSGGKQQHLLEV